MCNTSEGNTVKFPMKLFPQSNVNKYCPPDLKCSKRLTELASRQVSIERGWEKLFAPILLLIYFVCQGAIHGGSQLSGCGGAAPSSDMRPHCAETQY